MKLNNVFSGLSKRKKTKVLGRGIGCGKGKTSGKGHKGQKARTGVSINGFEGGQQSIFTRLPKRGFKPLQKKKCSVVNLQNIQSLINSGKIIIDETSIISKGLLFKLGLISSLKDKVKILGKGILKSKVVFDCDSVSESVNKQINLVE